MDTPKVSVVIPAYFAEHTVARTLDSILSQTVVPEEIIVVDDGSRDGTADVVRGYAPQVTLVQQPNGGPASARNHGIRVASGDWIALLDADDVWLPEKMERQLPHLQPDVALVHTHTRGDLHKTDQELTFDVLWKHNHIGTSTVVVNKALLQQVGGFCEDRPLIGIEDYNTWLKLARTGKRIVTVAEELTLYTPAENSLSQQIPKVIQAELYNVDLIARRFDLPAEMVRLKRAALYAEYARALFWLRDLPLARKYYAALLKERPSLSALQFWLASHLPVDLLNLPRQLSRRRAAVAPVSPTAT